MSMFTEEAGPLVRKPKAARVNPLTEEFAKLAQLRGKAYSITVATEAEAKTVVKDLRAASIVCKVSVKVKITEANATAWKVSFEPCDRILRPRKLDPVAAKAAESKDAIAKHK